MARLPKEFCQEIPFFMFSLLPHTLIISKPFGHEPKKRKERDGNGLSRNGEEMVIEMNFWKKFIEFWRMFWSSFLSPHG